MTNKNMGTGKILFILSLGLITGLLLRFGFPF